MERGPELSAITDSLLKKLASIVSSENASDAPEVLEHYSQDYSLVPQRMPNYVVWPTNAEQVQEIVKWANAENLPLIPRSSGVGFTGSTIPSQGGMVVDMSRMNNILDIDQRNRRARIEPGVTFGELQAELEKAGMCAYMPLSPRSTKSVLASV